MLIHKRTPQHQQGFTLVELMLAMAFLASILLFATLTFVQALNIYNKGLTIKQINETGRSLTADLNRSSNGAKSFVISNSSDPTVPPQFMCVGKTAYIWNIRGSSTTYTFSDGSGPINFVRTNDGIDARNSYCRDGNPPIVNKSEVTSLIGDQARVLDVDVLQPAEGGVEENALEVPLVRISLTIGTSSEDGAVDPIKEPIPSGGYFWHCPIGSSGNFCAVGTYATTIYLASGA